MIRGLSKAEVLIISRRSHICSVRNKCSLSGTYYDYSFLALPRHYYNPPLMYTEQYNTVPYLRVVMLVQQQCQEKYGGGTTDFSAGALIWIICYNMISLYFWLFGSYWGQTFRKHVLTKLKIFIEEKIHWCYKM